MHDGIEAEKMKGEESKMTWWEIALIILGVALISAFLGYALACILYMSKGD